MLQLSNIVQIAPEKKIEFQSAIVSWIENKRATDALSSAEVGALDAFDRIDALRKSEMVGMAIFCRSNPRADAVFAVYHLIMMMADNEDGVCRISQTTMGAILGRSAKAIGEVIKRLCDANLISVVGSSGRGAKYIPEVSRSTAIKNHRVWLIDALRATPPLKVGGTDIDPPATGGGLTPPLQVGGVATPPAEGGGTPPLKVGGTDIDPPATGGGTSLRRKISLNAHAREEREFTGSCNLASTAAVAVGIFAATAGLPAAAVPVDHASQIAAAQSAELAACWHTPKANMDAALNAAEGRAQRQIWLTDSGIVGIGEQFRSELSEFFPLVDITAGLMAAAPNVRPDHGAITCMQQVRRTFGYMHQDAVKQAARLAARNGSKQSQPTVPVTPDQRDRSMWERRMALWEKHGRVQWAKDWDAPPWEPGCKVPRDILEKYGF